MNIVNNKYLRVSQPIGEFYCCVMKARDLYEISYSDVRRMEKEQNNDDFESYLGIQRELNSSRVKKIAEYIQSVDATFPNSIIVAIDAKFINLDGENLSISYRNKDKGKIAKILDGQHRLAGFEDTDFCFTSQNNKKVDFEVLVTIFVEADLHTQSQVFTMVNQNQTKVNKSLVYDLESLALARNPTKTAHQIAVLLNSKSGSPFYKRIKRLGVKTPGVKTELITQAAFVDNLVKWTISKQPGLDRDILLGRKKNFIGLKDKNLPDNNNESFRKLPFRKSFIDGEDSVIAMNIYKFFLSVQDKWPESWNSDNKNSVLNKTVGFIALIRVLRDIYNKFVDDRIINYGDIIDEKQYANVLSEVDIHEEFFSEVDAVSKNSVYIYKKIIGYINV
ncbi:DGQHR domain-containing protein [Morganella morganii]|uniref:DGQHR domain-containing protein n=1 Tax=Morganella morganii TaxID=582 RepID=UPI0021A7E336|nr:DGQHR domain-containing protein [Morganella morganii]